MIVIASAHAAPQAQLPGQFGKLLKNLPLLFSAGLVVASGGFGAVYAWTAAAQHGVVLGSLAVLMAVSLEGAKPLAVVRAGQALRSWQFGSSAALASLALVAIAYSLTAELSLMARTRADATASRAAVIGHTAQTKAQHDRLTSELASIVFTRPSAAVVFEINDLKALPKVGDCIRIDGPVSKRVCPQIAALEQEYTLQAHREDVERKLSGLEDASKLPTAMRADRRSCA